MGAIGGTWELATTSQIDSAMDAATALAACTPSHWGASTSDLCNFRAALVYCLHLLPGGVDGCNVEIKTNANISLTAGPLVLVFSSATPVKVTINGNGASIYSSSVGGQFLTTSLNVNSTSSSRRRRLVSSSSSHSFVVLRNLTLVGFGSNATNGGAIFLHDVNTVSLTDILFESNQGANGGALYIKNASEVALNRVSFSKNVAHNGGAVFLQNIGRVAVSRVAFVSNQASNVGGAMVIHLSSSLSIENNLFDTNSAANFAGAVAMYDLRYLASVYNNTFNKNSAIYGSSIVMKSCSNSSFNLNKFSENNALVGGGTLYWIKGTSITSQTPLFINNKFHNNIVGAQLNMLDIATDAIMFVSNPHSLLFLDYGSLTPLSNKMTTVDAFGQLLFFENNETMTNSLAPSQTSCGYNAGSVSLNGKLSSTILNGESTFTGWGGVCNPGGAINVTFTTLFSSIPVDFPQYSSKLMVPYSETLIRKVQGSVHVQFRKCRVGEYYDFFNTKSICVLCVNSYSFLPNLDNNIISCLACPPLALSCTGDLILLHPGTWRWNFYATTIWTCPYPAGCIGGNATGLAACAIGYEGVMCGVCSAAFYLSSDGTSCLPCTGSSSFSSGQLVLLVILFFIFVIVLVFYIQRYKRQQKAATKCLDDDEIELKRYIDDENFNKTMARWTPRFKIIISTYVRSYSYLK